jgi:hypothetical protein
MLGSYVSTNDITRRLADVENIWIEPELPGERTALAP